MISSLASQVERNGVILPLRYARQKTMRGVIMFYNISGIVERVVREGDATLCKLAVHYLHKRYAQQEGSKHRNIWYYL
ncbi:hypothetical protein B6U67_03125 [Methanosarcinales archaeon ex4484_138]|nr:MAG: hypothetical protein B6U67_03125 [Methanosarcinales archaeon ex4484_138]